MRRCQKLKDAAAGEVRHDRTSPCVKNQQHVLNTSLPVHWLRFFENTLLERDGHEPIDCWLLSGLIVFSIKHQEAEKMLTTVSKATPSAVVLYPNKTQIYSAFYNSRQRRKFSHFRSCIKCLNVSSLQLYNMQGTIYECNNVSLVKYSTEAMHCSHHCWKVSLPAWPPQFLLENMLNILMLLQ